LKHPIAITGLSSISPLGVDTSSQWEKYQDAMSCIQWDEDLQAFVAALPENALQEIAKLRLENSTYKKLDATVLYAIYVSRKAIGQANWKQGDFGINIGSSRGATHLFETYYSAFAKAETTSTLASPTTTLGNISSWVANDLQSSGPEISHSITCSTALHAVLNGAAWIQSGMTDKFLVGGTEASLTPFTLAQMRAMKLMPTSTTSERYPCKSLDLEKKSNSMVLGEGAGMICLESGTPDTALAQIIGLGYATEPLKHAVSLSANGSCFQKSMCMALGDLDPSEIDVIVMHAPGTVKGDLAEKKAIETIFCNKTPFLTTNKWKIGHTFGASGLLSLEMAILMLQKQQCITVPFLPAQQIPKRIQKVLINAVGFGGNAVSILLSK